MTRVHCPSSSPSEKALMRSQNRVNRKHRLTPYGQYLLELGFQHKRSSNRILRKQYSLEREQMRSISGRIPHLEPCNGNNTDLGKWRRVAQGYLMPARLIPSNLIKISFHPSFLCFVFRSSDINLRVRFEATSVVSYCARSFRTSFASRRSIF